MRHTSAKETKLYSSLVLLTLVCTPRSI